MPPKLFNRVCAHPEAICWIVGASVLNGIVLAVPFDGVWLISIALDWQGWALLIFAIAGSIGLGFFLGIFTCWPWMRPICSRVNGAPFKNGDHVMILAGPLRGTRAEIEDITKGQGGWDVVWLNLGPEHKKAFSNIFEEYQLMRIKEGEQAGAANEARPSKSTQTLG